MSPTRAARRGRPRSTSEPGVGCRRRGGPGSRALFHRADRTRLFLVALATMLAVMILPLCRLPSAAPGRSGTPLTTRPPAASGARDDTAVRRAALSLCRNGDVGRGLGRAARRFRSDSGGPVDRGAVALLGRAPRGARRRAVHSAASRGAAAARRRTRGKRGHMRLLIADSAASLAFAVIVAGGGLSTIFPLTVARFTRDSRHAARPPARRSSSRASAAPWCRRSSGFISRHTGSLTAGLFVALAGCLAMERCSWSPLARVTDQ